MLSFANGVCVCVVVKEIQLSQEVSKMITILPKITIFSKSNVFMYFKSKPSFFKTYNQPQNIF
jgi:hypothetical protein